MYKDNNKYRIKFTWQSFFALALLLVLLLSLTACETATPTDVPLIVSPNNMNLAATTSSTPQPKPTTTNVATFSPSVVITAKGINLPTLAPLPKTSVAPPLPTPTNTPPLPTATPKPSANSDLSEFTAGLLPQFADDVNNNVDLNRYYLKISIEPSQKMLHGSEQIIFHNTTGVAFKNVALRLYPNFPKGALGNGGNVHSQIISASVDSTSVTPQYTAQNTAVLLPFATPLPPDASVTLEVSFTATIATVPDGTWQMPSYYPMLAVYDASGWRLDVTDFADHVYAESAFYAAEITLPSNLTLVTTGKTVNKTDNSDKTTTYSIRSGPVREFAMSMGDFTVVSAMAGINKDVQINVYKARQSPLDANQILQVAMGALTDCEKRYGLYPYPVLNFHLQPNTYDGGDEYPGLIMLYSTNPVNVITRYMVAHETAHQWWYGVVGDDIYKQPWLDETFAQYSGIIYDQDVAGASVADIDWTREVQNRYQAAINYGDLPIGDSLTQYGNFSRYYQTVYGKGAYFLNMLRKQLGDEVFFKALQTCYQRYRYRVITTNAVEQIFEEVSGKSLESLFNQWVK